MPGSDLEVFDYLLSDASTPEEIDFLTYALFAFSKKQWVEHFAKQNGRPPDQGEIDGWIAQKSDYDFTRMRREAADFFDEAAKEYLASHIETEKINAVSSSILGEIKRYTSPWKDLGIAMLMAVIAPILVGTVLFLFSIFDSSFQFHINAAASPPAANQTK